MFASTDTVDEILSGLGTRLAEHRLSRRLTQEELAKRAGVSKRTVERLETSTSDVRLAAFVAVCQTLGLTEGFDALAPAVKLGPMALANGERLPRRIRKSSRTKDGIWEERA